MTQDMIVLANGICMVSSAIVNGELPGTIVLQGTTESTMRIEPT